MSAKKKPAVVKVSGLRGFRDAVASVQKQAAQNFAAAIDDGLKSLKVKPKPALTTRELQDALMVQAQMIAQLRAEVRGMKGRLTRMGLQQGKRFIRLEDDATALALAVREADEQVERNFAAALRAHEHRIVRYLGDKYAKEAGISAFQHNVGPTPDCIDPARVHAPKPNDPPPLTRWQRFKIWWVVP